MMIHGDYDVAPEGREWPGVPLTDADIKAAKPFRGWCPLYREWHGMLAELSPGELDKTPSHNAYHCQRLALAMLDAGCWIGGPLTLAGCGGVLRGNHRWRALLWIFPAFARPVNEWRRFEILRQFTPPIEQADAPSVATCWRGRHCPSQWGKL